MEPGFVFKGRWVAFDVDQFPYSWKGLCKKTVECVACLLGRWNGSPGTDGKGGCDLVEVLKAYSILDRNVCVIDRRRGKDERKEIKAGGFEFGSCCGQEENGEATRCEHYGSVSSNRVALDVAGEEVLLTLEVTEVKVGCPGKVKNRDGLKERA
ncbi:hypothetical protein Tco_0953982 [Tanacetum coccineum]|uniref:Uncharacterized protein n=1 Tax=Tanacetum coccineum TaxID=301880 RepID=A0ABQ5E1I0_9ASTR